MNPKQFLSIGGVVLVLVGILGFIGVIGPTKEASLLGETWWFDDAENYAHLVLGVVALILAYGVKNAGIQKGVTALVGILGLIVGIYGFVSPDFLGANLENPLDNILHLVVGIWALMSLKGKAVSAPAGGMS